MPAQVVERGWRRLVIAAAFGFAAFVSGPAHADSCAEQAWDIVHARWVGRRDLSFWISAPIDDIPRDKRLEADRFEAYERFPCPTRRLHSVITCTATHDPLPEGAADLLREPLAKTEPDLRRRFDTCWREEA